MKFTIILLFIGLPLWVSAQCGSTTAHTASIVGQDNSVGSVNWAGFTNTQISDNSYASAGTFLGVLATADSKYLVFNNFGFAIPAGAAICGIEVSREGSASGLLVGSYIRDNSVLIIKNNVIDDTEHAVGTNWSGSDAAALYGSASDTWGLSWTANDINAAGFGVAISVRMAAGMASLFLTANVDRVSITVYYNLVLPTRMESFTARATDNKVKLDWATLMEADNSHFLVQRSGPSLEWETKAIVKGAGNSNEKKHYQWIDEQPIPMNYYRLIQTDINSRTTTSSTAIIKMVNRSITVKVFPNPTSEQLTIQSGNVIEYLKLSDRSGRLIKPRFHKLNTREWQLFVDDLVKGIYFLQVGTNVSLENKAIFVK
jgi:hypothetical protein